MKIVRNKTGKGTNVYITKSYRYNGKSTSIVVLNVGKEEELARLHKDTKAYINEVKKECEKNDRHSRSTKRVHLTARYDFQEKESNYLYGGHLPLRSFFRKLRLHELCEDIAKKYKFTYDLKAILEYLIYSRVLFPKSKKATFDMINRFVDAPSIEEHQIYRALDVIEKNMDLIQAHVYKYSHKIVKRDKTVLYYDCTNFFFESEIDKGLKQHGYSKEHRPNPIVQMGLFTDGEGIPLAFDITPGNTCEQITLRPLEEKVLKDFNLSKVIVCTDAGLSSYTNREFNDRQNRAFVVTQSIRKLPRHLREWAIGDKDWKSLKDSKISKATFVDEDSDRLYKARAMLEDFTINNMKLKQDWRLIVTYSPEYASYQKTLREAQIVRAKSLINNPSRFNKTNTTDCKRFIKNLAFDSNGEIVKNKLIYDEEIVKEEEAYDGLYALTTNLEGKVQDIVNIAHNRYKIEEAFRTMKTDFKARPVYLQNDNRIKAHFVTCFLALLIYRLLDAKMEHKYTGTTLLNCLRELRYVKADNGYLTSACEIKVLKEIDAMLDLPISYAAYTNENMRNLINSSKRY